MYIYIPDTASTFLEINELYDRQLCSLGPYAINCPEEDVCIKTQQYDSHSTSMHITAVLL
jgi:hypothetical protein